ncbi:MAG: hypothetical protein ABI266_10080 [Ginsengibacter sp.]
MKNLSVVLLFLALVCHKDIYANTNDIIWTDTIPTFLTGQFMDDYGIGYTINDTIWLQLPNVKYHILQCDTSAQYLLARNDERNPGDPGLFTRIDYMHLNDMKPFEWGFCLTVYDAKTMEEAKLKSKADRTNPKTGCNGYPFSRMKIRD